MATRVLQNPAAFGGALVVQVDRGLQEILRRVQRARMEQVMHGMSDRQLEQMGVRRSEIPERARQLFCGEER